MRTTIGQQRWKPVPKFVIFFIGLIPLVAVTDWLRANLGDILSFFSAILYVVVLRLLAEKWGRAVIVSADEVSKSEPRGPENGQKGSE